MEFIWLFSKIEIKKWKCDNFFRKLGYKSGIFTKFFQKIIENEILAIYFV
jgi:hypothetical protein